MVLGIFIIPLLDRRGGTSESAQNVQANELACRRQVTGWWILNLIPPPRLNKFISFICFGTPPDQEGCCFKLSLTKQFMIVFFFFLKCQ